MAWDPINESELNPGFAALKHMRQAWNCLKWLYGQIGSFSSNGVLNGSFEVDSDGNSQPDNWTLSTFPGGAGFLTATSAHGIRSTCLVHPGGAGNGGGYYQSDYVICSDLQQVVLSFIHWATAAGMNNQVWAQYYDTEKVHISDATLYSSTNNPTVPTSFVTAFTPPAGTRFFKVLLMGGYSDTAVAGTAYFDGVGLAGLDALATRFFDLALSGSTVGTDWSDVASTMLPMPFCSMLVLLSVPVTVINGAMRLRIGTSYSPVVDGYGMPSGLNQLLSFRFRSDSSGQPVTIHLQVRNLEGMETFGGTTDTARLRIDI
jgi:hypothetical protein